MLSPLSKNVNMLGLRNTDWYDLDISGPAYPRLSNVNDVLLVIVITVNSVVIAEAISNVSISPTVNSVVK